MNDKICIVTPTLGCGGLERVVSEIANYASKNAYDVTIICLIRSDIHYQLNSNVKVVMPSFNYKKNFLNKIKTTFYLITMLRKIKPSSVLGFSEAFNPLTIFSARMTLNKVYVSDRSSPGREQGFRTNLTRRVLYPFAHGMIAQTDQAKKSLKNKKYNENITIIANPLREINDCYFKSNSNMIVTVGRLVPSKNISSLIDIFYSMHNAEDWKLIIVGDGPEKVFLEKKIIDLNLTERVTLVGAVKDVDKYLAQASIFAFPSLSEGFPNALSEAMAFPLACISYDCVAGPSDIIKHKLNGLLVPINNIKAFKDELQKLIDSRHLINYYKENSFLNRKIFDRDIICRKYLNFILEK